MQRAEAAVVIALVLAASGCTRLLRDAPPPLVTPCLQEPAAAVADEPERPAAGEPLTDTYVVALLGWANSLLGTITADRTAWRGERRCIHALRDAGQVQ